MKIFSIKNQKGMMTLEILIAFAILILNITAVMLLINGGQSMSIDSQTNQEAIAKAQEQLAAARSTDFDSVVNIPATSDGIYQKSLSVSSIDSDTKNIVSTVNWNNGRDLSVIFSTIITNFKNPINTCNATLTGDWSNPQIVNTGATIDIDSSSVLTDLAVGGIYAYITGDSASSSKKDFYIVNISDPKNPTLYSNPLDTGPGLNAVVVSGHYAYVANSSTTAQLQVIDITTKNSPSLYKSFKLPTTDSDIGTVGHSIFYYQGKVYLGTQKSGKAGFHIIDVSNLGSINEVGYLEVPSTINKIKVSGSYAYIASADSTRELGILNISNPASIGSISLYNASNTTNFGYGNSLAINGNTLYLGRTFDPSASNKELNVLDITTLTISPLPSSSAQKISDSVNGLVARSNYILLSTNSQFQIRKVSDLSLYGSLALSSSSLNINCSGNYVYVGVLGVVGATNKDVLKVIGPGPV